MESEFENLLRRQPLRQIPGEWRAEILAASRPAPRASRLREILSTFNLQPSTAFRWAALAAAWVVILVLNHAARDTASVKMAKSAPPPPQVLLALAEQKKMFAELIGTANVTAPSDRPKIFLPRPHSELQLETFIS